MILEGQRETEMVLRLMPDTVPELEELYTVQLIAVEGGATLDTNPNLIKSHIRSAAMFFLTDIAYIDFKGEKVRDWIN